MGMDLGLISRYDGGATCLNRKKSNLVNLRSWIKIFSSNGSMRTVFKTVMQMKRRFCRKKWL